MLPNELPNIKGEYQFNFPLKQISYLKVGGNCDVFYAPTDKNDLKNFLENKPDNLKITLLGNMSNVLISDRGIRGCVISLKHLNKTMFFEGYLESEAGILLPNLINKCAKQNISCCEKLSYIPGSLGGAIYMNAGIPDFEIKDILISVDCVDFLGQEKTIKKEDLKMTYRNGNLPKESIILSAKLKTHKKNKNEILTEIKKIYEKRMKSQPIGFPTCGSTFKNPTGIKAWELIKKSGCESLEVGRAKISDIHCNFMINMGNAKASDFIELIKIVKSKVFEKTGYMLEEEIQIIGDEW